MSASVLNLILKTEIQMLVQKNLDELTLGLLVNGFVILVSEFIEMVPGLPQNFSALACKTLDKFLLRFFFELLSLGSNKFHRFVLELPAAETGNHHSLVGEIQLLLSPDLLPSVSDEQSQSVHRHVLAFAWSREKGICGRAVETGSEIPALLKELLFLEDLVR
jgi:hypothetical protein